MFRDIGYHAEFERMDTKKFYIPHTRQRGYLFAIRKNPCHGKIKIPSNVVTNWKGMVKDLERRKSGMMCSF
jgi:site-specific DNA-cytosine methylase